MTDTKKIEYKDFNEGEWFKKVAACNEIIIKCLAICHDYFFRDGRDMNAKLLSQLLKMPDKHKAMMYDRNKSYHAELGDWCIDLYDYINDSLCEDFDEDDYFAPFAA